VETLFALLIFFAVITPILRFGYWTKIFGSMENFIFVCLGVIVLSLSRFFQNF